MYLCKYPHGTCMFVCVCICVCVCVCVCVTCLVPLFACACMYIYCMRYMYCIYYITLPFQLVGLISSVVIAVVLVLMGFVFEQLPRVSGTP